MFRDTFRKTHPAALAGRSPPAALTYSFDYRLLRPNLAGEQTNKVGALQSATRHVSMSRSSTARLMTSRRPSLSPWLALPASARPPS